MPTKKFVVVVGDDIAGDLVVPANEKYLPLQEALESQFFVVEIPLTNELAIGDTYTGSTVIAD